jgi:two-component system, NtrC family, response regulator HupR/HoxA
MGIKKIKVLVVDDEINFLKLLNSVLSERGYLTILASSGDEALKKLKIEKNIAVILSDHRMPGMNGVELLEKAKELAPLAPRIIMTAYQNAEMMEDSINIAEVYKFITKPVEINNLLKIIITAVNRYQNNLDLIEQTKK